MRLPSGDHNLQVVERARDLKKLRQDHSAQVATSKDTDLEWWHLVEELDRVLHDVRRRVVHGTATWCAARLGRVLLLSNIAMLAFLVIAGFIVAKGPSLLTFLQQEGLLIEDKVIEDTGEEDALQHDQIADDLTRQESVLKLLIRDEIIKPLFAETGHSTHFEEVAGFKAWHMIGLTSTVHTASSLRLWVLTLRTGSVGDAEGRGRLSISITLHDMD